jgi:large subunit ribosomal protein L4
MNLSIAAPGSGADKAIEVSETAFGREFNEALVHQVVVAYMAGARQGTKAQKTRSEVAGGGKKPWRQKGYGPCSRRHDPQPDLAWGRDLRGEARATSRRRSTARCTAAPCARSFSELVRQERLVVVEDFTLEPEDEGARREARRARSRATS